MQGVNITENSLQNLSPDTQYTEGVLSLFLLNDYVPSTLESPLQRERKEGNSDEKENTAATALS